jgi:hypothetical protein
MNRSKPQPDDSRQTRTNVLSAESAALAYLWTRTPILKEVWDVVDAVGAWPGATIAPDHDGLSLMLRGVTLGHLDWNGRLDLPFRPEVRDRLVAEEMASLDPDRAETNGVVFVVRSGVDVDRAIWLLRLEYLIVDANADAHALDIAHPYQFQRTAAATKHDSPAV